IPDIGIYLLVSLGEMKILTMGLASKTLLNNTSSGFFSEVDVFVLLFFSFFFFRFFFLFYRSKYKHCSRDWAKHIFNHSGRIRICLLPFLAETQAAYQYSQEEAKE